MGPTTRIKKLNANVQQSAAGPTNTILSIVASGVHEATRAEDLLQPKTFENFINLAQDQGAGMFFSYKNFFVN